MSSLIKVHTVGAELFQVERRTDMAKLIVAFRSFVNVPKNDFMLWSYSVQCNMCISAHSQK
jgi:hypothetical protein